MDVETIQRLFVDAMASDTFTRYSTRAGEWNIAGNCDDPQTVVLYSRQTGNIKRALDGRFLPGIELTLKVVCRHCLWCRKKKALHWAYRAETEIAQASRNWFCTFTLNPDNHVRMRWLAASKIGNFEGQPPRKKFELVAKEVGKEFTKTLKRIRKNTGHSFRYLVVTEIHDSDKTSPEMRGNPHLHALIHEKPGQLIRKADIQSEWSLGYSNVKLCDVGAGWYLTKYLTKATEGRIRPSLWYGSSH